MTTNYSMLSVGTGTFTLLKSTLVPAVATGTAKEGRAPETGVPLGTSIAWLTSGMEKELSEFPTDEESIPGTLPAEGAA